MAARFDLPLPDHGCAPASAIAEWFDRAQPGLVRSAGPRYFGFVTGGATPAALAGDWLASALDQNAGMWLMSPAAAQTELTVVRWLLELFHLPESWSGALTSGATMANLSGLAAARQWASHKSGFDAAREGLAAAAPIPVIASTEVHQSALKALSILGLGREAVQLVPAVDGAIDVDAFDRVMSVIESPAIVIANAGEVNTGAFDPIRAMADRCAAHAPGAWLHVDGAFGLYAALSPQHRRLLDGIELADSVASDAHKWLNVPYDCGFVFVRDAWLPARCLLDVSAVPLPGRAAGRLERPRLRPRELAADARARRLVRVARGRAVGVSGNCRAVDLKCEPVRRLGLRAAVTGANGPGASQHCLLPGQDRWRRRTRE